MAELKVELTKQYDESSTWTDRGTGADQDVSIWKPLARPGFSLVGDVARAGYGRPREGVLTVAVDQPGPGAPPILPVFGFRKAWSDEGSGADEDVSLWLPQAREPGYLPLGLVASPSYDEPSPEGYVVVRKDLARPAFWLDKIWSMKGDFVFAQSSFWSMWGGQKDPGLVPGTFGASSRNNSQPGFKLYTLARPSTQA